MKRKADEKISLGEKANLRNKEKGVRKEATQKGTERKKEWDGKETPGWMG